MCENSILTAFKSDFKEYVPLTEANTGTYISQYYKAKSSNYTHVFFFLSIFGFVCFWSEFGSAKDAASLRECEDVTKFNTKIIMKINTIFITYNFMADSHISLSSLEDNNSTFII